MGRVRTCERGPKVWGWVRRTPLPVLPVMPVMPVLLCALVTAASAMAGPPVAGAAKAEPTLKMKLLGTAVIKPNPNRPDFYGALYTDGVRWAAYEPTMGTTRIINTITSGAVNRPDPVGCNGQLIAVGGGKLLYACANPECPGEAELCTVKSTEQSTREYETTRYVIEDIIGAAQHPMAGENHLPTGSTANEGGSGIIDAIGKEWAEGSIGTHFGTATFFVNWHTGVMEKEEPALGDATFYEDLNSRELLQSLCEPLARPVSDDSGSPPFAPIQYESPFAVIGPLGYEQVLLQLHRCGSDRRMLLPEGGPYASSVQLGGGVLSWVGSGNRGNYIKNGGAYVTQMLPRSRNWHGPLYRLKLPNPKILTEYTPFILQHTSTMVFATVEPEGSQYSRVYYSRLPWASAGRKRSDRRPGGRMG